MQELSNLFSTIWVDAVRYTYIKAIFTMIAPFILAIIILPVIIILTKKEREQKAQHPNYDLFDNWIAPVIILLWGVLGCIILITTLMLPETIASFTHPEGATVINLFHKPR